MKQFITRLFVSIPLVLAALSASAYNFEVDGIYYSYSGSGVAVTYQSYSNGYYSVYEGDIVIPSSVSYNGNDYTVVAIGDYAFYRCYKLTSVTLPNSVKSIGSSAFEYCSSLKSISIPEDITIIESRVFSDCKSLESISFLGNKVTSIGYEAFYNTRISSISNLENVTTIGYSAFKDCLNLQSLGSLSSITSIGTNAFSGCSNLNTLFFHGSEVPTIASVFPESTTVLVSASLLDQYKAASVWSDMSSRILPIDMVQTDWDVTTTASQTTSGLQTAIGESNLDNVISLKVTGEINGYDIFVMRNKMSNLHVLDLSDAVIRKSVGNYCYYSSFYTQDDILGGYAFYSLPKLTKVTLPKGIKEIRGYAFQNCTNLTQVILNPGVTTIYWYAFQYANLTHLSLPEGLTRISNGAFGSNTNLEEVSFPSSLEKIEGAAFSSCGKLNTIKFADKAKLQEIQDGAFEYCRSLVQIELPSNVEKIGTQAFFSCSRLLEITLPSSLKSIGSQAFSGCDKLNTVRATAIEAKSVQMEDNSFSTYSSATLHIPFDEDTNWHATYDSYYWDTQWGQFHTLSKWKPSYDKIVISDDYDQSEGTIPGDDIDAEFNENSGYILGDEAEQELGDVNVKHDGENGGSIIAGDNLTINGNLNAEITVTAGRWYFFCFPFNIKVSDIEAPGEYAIRTYDGAQRGNSGKTGWRNLKDTEATLQAGQGYIFHFAQGGTMRILMREHDFTQHVDPALQTHTAENKQDASWNFVGNPFLSYYDIADISGFSAPITYWNGSGYSAVRPGDDDFALAPYQAFFVQKPASGSDEVGFNANDRETYKKSQARLQQAAARRAKARINPDRLLINIQLSDGEHTDQTRVVFNDQQTMDYELECDASKFMSTESIPQLYSIYDKVKYAINERPTRGGEVQLGIDIKTAGSYTIRMARMDAPVELIDTKMGITVDMRHGEYSFDAEAGQDNSRFVIRKIDDVNGLPNTIGEAMDPASYYSVSGTMNSQQNSGINIVKQGNKVQKIMVK